MTYLKPKIWKVTMKSNKIQLLVLVFLVLNTLLHQQIFLVTDLLSISDSYWKNMLSATRSWILRICLMEIKWQNLESLLVLLLISFISLHLLVCKSEMDYISMFIQGSSTIPVFQIPQFGRWYLDFGPMEFGWPITVKKILSDKIMLSLFL